MAENTQTQLQINTLRTLQESYDALVEAQSAQATATALEAAKQAILTAISNIDIDTSDLAKEATLEAVGLDAAAAKTAAEAADIAASAAEAAIQRIIDAHILEFNTDGVVWTHPEEITPLKLLMYKDTITHLIDDSIESMSNAPAVDMPNLEYAEFRKLDQIYEDQPNKFFYNDNLKAEFVHFPSLTSFSSSYTSNKHVREYYFDVLTKINSYHAFWNCSVLRKIYIPKVNEFNQPFSGCPDLIDIITGSNFLGNTSLYWWSPTNALLSTSSSLVEEGESFTNNLEKLLYNIREHFAANLPTITDGYSITFSAAVKAAILADQPTADAFTNRGWTIA